jgi:DNA-binding transcriptional ArsR family regulator
MIMKTLWAVLMEPNRLHIVELLRDGPLTVGQIAERLGLQQPQVSKHLSRFSVKRPLWRSSRRRTAEFIS